MAGKRRAAGDAARPPGLRVAPDRDRAGAGAGWRSPPRLRARRRGLPDRHACTAGRWVDEAMTSPLSGRRVLVSCQHGIDRLGAGVTEKSLELQSHLAANGFLPEYQAGDRNGDDHQGPKREDRIIRKRRPQLGVLVLHPTRRRFFGQGPPAHHESLAFWPQRFEWTPVPPTFWIDCLRRTQSPCDAALAPLTVPTTNQLFRLISITGAMTYVLRDVQ